MKQSCDFERFDPPVVTEKMLRRELERRGRELGLRFLTLEVRPSNAAALGLYRGMGYREEGRRRDFYTDPREDALLLTKYLKNDNTEGT